MSDELIDVTPINKPPGTEFIAARPMTEAEYLALLPARMAKAVDEINERMAGVLPAGMRFEWADDAVGQHPG